jgi:hypothetical protein
MYSPPPLPLQPSPTRDACASYLLADGRRSLKIGGRVEEGVEIGHGARWEVTKSFPPPFLLFTDARCSSRHLHCRLRPCAEDSLLHQRAWRFACTARNCRTGRSSRARPDTALRSGSCKNTARPRQPNGSKIAGPMRAKGDPGNQTRPIFSK